MDRESRAGSRFRSPRPARYLSLVRLSGRYIPCLSSLSSSPSCSSYSSPSSSSSSFHLSPLPPRPPLPPLPPLLPQRLLPCLGLDPLLVNLLLLLFLLFLLVLLGRSLPSPNRATPHLFRIPQSPLVELDHQHPVDRLHLPGVPHGRDDLVPLLGVCFGESETDAAARERGRWSVIIPVSRDRGFAMGQSIMSIRREAEDRVTMSRQRSGSGHSPSIGASDQNGGHDNESVGTSVLRGCGITRCRG